MEKRELVCVSCPMGCAITVELDDNGQVTSVTGNTCPRGDKYARQECTHPERMVPLMVSVSMNFAVLYEVAGMVTCMFSSSCFEGSSSAQMHWNGRTRKVKRQTILLK